MTAWLQPLSAQLGCIQTRSAGAGIPIGNQREEFPPGVAGCQEQLQNSKSFKKKKKVCDGEQRNSLFLQCAGLSLPSFSGDRYWITRAACKCWCPSQWCLFWSSAKLEFYFLSNTRCWCRTTSTFALLAAEGDGNMPSRSNTFL